MRTHPYWYDELWEKVAVASIRSGQLPGDAVKAADYVVDALSARKQERRQREQKCAP